MLFEQACAIVDLETTGGHITRDRITEIGVILLDGERIERFSTLVNPGQPIPPFIVNMTGISDEMVADAPPFEALAERLLAMLEGRLFIAHNARFDYGFLKNEFRRVGLRFQTEVLCSVKLSRRLYPQHFKHNLDSLIERHGIVLAERHRALADAEAVYHFLQSARQELGDEPVRAAAAYLMATPTVPEGLDADVVDQLPDVPGVYLFFGEADQPLYVGKTVNLRSGVLKHFAGEPGDKALAEAVRRIDWQETIGEFGAQLMALQLIRELKPSHNLKGRPSQELCSLQLASEADGFVRPRTVAASEVDFSRVATLYGLYRNPREAKKVLTDLARAQELCPAVLGIEPVTSKKGTACCARQAGRCRGACVGVESAESHNARLIAALTRLKVKSWPFPDAVAVVESDPVTGESVEHLFDRWCYLGSRSGADESLDGAPSFDLDTYKLLSAYLKKPFEHTSVRLLETVAGD
ncbi:exonuclease domain-containing protein [Neisseriaceae bacterium JH1-16]|nr:exonuclease domain-containing protein [Neisseriaceae bacterium JH1-16]